MAGEVGGAEEAFFLGGEGGEEDGAAEAGGGGELFGGGEEGGGAEGVVEGAVVDGVAVEGGSDADVVEVGGDDDGFAGERGIGAGEPAEDVGAGDVGHGGATADSDFDVEREGLRLAALGSGEDGVDRLRRVFEERGGGGAVDGGGGAELGVGFLEGAVGIDQAHRGETGAVDREGPGLAPLLDGGEHGDDADGAAADELGGFLARVVGLGGGGEALGGAGEDDGNFALNVDAGGEIGVVELGGVDAEADEDGGRGDLARGGAGGGAGEHVVDRSEGDLGAGVADDEFAGFEVEAGFAHGEGLHVAPVAGGLDAEAQELGGDVGHGKAVAAGAGGAALHEIVGEEGDVGADAALGGVGGVFGAGGWGDEGEAGGGSEGERAEARETDHG